MNPILRVILTTIADTIIFFIVAFLVLAATADESNGFWGISRTGVALIGATPTSIMVAFPSGLILGLLAPRIIHNIPYVLAVSAGIALVFVFGWAILLASGNEGESRFLFSVPFFIALAIATLSNLLTMILVKPAFSERASDAKS